ncbi:unnamed protein product [Dovyalis caffra]|uniref:Uncharacterized protein n=1 Tax=Dovyalis caffra TaxID=77055 RepID=A0AAV1S8I5_9ROSI|nr:unnamed protein product [Dovyalis caffra]
MWGANKQSSDPLPYVNANVNAKKRSTRQHPIGLNGTPKRVVGSDCYLGMEQPGGLFQLSTIQPDMFLPDVVT